MEGEMKQIAVFWLVGLFLLAVSAGCSSQIMRVPIDPYVTPDITSRYIKKVAVLPVVIPDYLAGQGGESVSVEMTNQFMTELAGRRLYNLVGGDRVKKALQQVYGQPRDWLYQGTVAAAIRVGRELKVDGVVYGRVKRYLQANLSQSEVEIEFQLVEISSLETVWSVREMFIGRGGSPTLNEPVTSPTARRLSQAAVTGAAERVAEIYEHGGPFEVSNISTRQIWGYSLLSTGAVSTVVAGYYLTMSYNAYRHYQEADNPADLDRYQDNTEEYDRMWMIFGGAGAALLGTGAYLLLTDPARRLASYGESPTRVAIMPFVTPNSFLLGCAWRF